jgi:hypothetical protein
MKSTDLKSVDPKGSCGFESRHRYHQFTRKKASGLDPEAFFVCRGLRKIKHNWMHSEVRFRAEKNGVPYFLAESEAKQSAPRKEAAGARARNAVEDLMEGTDAQRTVLLPRRTSVGSEWFWREPDKIKA